MNLPLPEILTQQNIKPLAKYLFVPEYKYGLILPLQGDIISGGGGSNPLFSSGSGRVLIQSQRHRTTQQEGVVNEIELLFINDTNQAQRCDVNPGFYLRPNYGNPLNVSVTVNDGRQTFIQFLNFLNNNDFYAGLIRIELLTGNNLPLFSIFRSTINPDTREEQIQAHQFLISPYQMQANVVDAIVRGFKLSSTSSFYVNLPANSRIKITLFPESAQYNFERDIAVETPQVDGLDLVSSDDFDVFTNDFDDVDGIYRSSAERAQRRAERKAARIAARYERRQSAINDREARFRFNIDTFWAKAKAELTIEEIELITVMQFAQPEKFKRLVIEYDFFLPFSKISDYL